MRLPTFFLAAALFMTPLLASGASVVQRARAITGFEDMDDSPAEVKVKEWEPLAESNRDYAGYVSGPANVSYAFDEGYESIVDSRHRLEALVQGMSAFQRKELTVKLQGVDSQVVKRWLDELNTGIFGHFRLESGGRCAVLKATYSPAARIFAAFRNPEVELQLTRREKQVLQTCSQWICDNIQRGMPCEMALKRSHDALLDGTLYTKGKHGVDDVILDGVGSCVAYASSTQLLLSMLGLECRLVSGSAEMNHVWNLVRVNKKWYHLDTAWNDPAAGAGRRMYTYYLLTDAEIASDHEWPNPELYPRSQDFNEWNFRMRHERRRCWLTAPGPCPLPQEADSILKILSDMHVLEEVEQVARPALSSLHGEKKRARDDKEVRCLSSADIDRALAARLRELDESTLNLACAAEIPDWQMRRMVAESSLPQYSSLHSVVYDDDAKRISINFRFSTHRRLLAAAQYSAAAEKLNQKEKKALSMCRRLAETYGAPWKTPRQKVRDVYLALIEQFSPSDKQQGLEAAMSGRQYGSLAYAEAMFVTCHLMKVPCRMVHGRTEDGYHVWNLVQPDKRKWLHADAAKDDVSGRVSEHQCEFLLRSDAQMRPTHVWDASELLPVNSALPAWKQ